MDVIGASAIRAGMRRLLPGLLLVLIAGTAGAVPPPPPPPTPPAPDAPDAPPRPGENLPPRYPPAENGARESGEVILILDLAPDGAVTHVEVERSSGFPRLDAAAVEAAAGWNFSPMQSGGKPFGPRIRVPVNFSPD